MRNKLKIFFKWASSYLITRSMNNDKVHLTFDDGPHPINTKKLLKVLDSHNVKATFFMVGRQMELYPDMVKLVQDKGHCIGYHSYSHLHAKDMGFKKTIQELRQAKELEESFDISFKSLYRPPYGELTIPVLAAVLLSGWKVILWSKDSRDSYICWQDAANEISSNKIRPGEVILLHDDYKDTSNTIDLVLKDYEKGSLKMASL